MFTGRAAAAPWTVPASEAAGLFLFVVALSQSGPDPGNGAVTPEPPMGHLPLQEERMTEGWETPDHFLAGHPTCALAVRSSRSWGVMDPRVSTGSLSQGSWSPGPSLVGEAGVAKKERAPS